MIGPNWMSRPQEISRQMHTNRGWRLQRDQPYRRWTPHAGLCTEILFSGGCHFFYFAIGNHGWEGLFLGQLRIGLIWIRPIRFLCILRVSFCHLSMLYTLWGFSGSASSYHIWLPFAPCIWTPSTLFLFPSCLGLEIPVLYLVGIGEN